MFLSDAHRFSVSLRLSVAGPAKSRPVSGVSLSQSGGTTIISETNGAQEQTTISKRFATDDAIYCQPVFNSRRGLESGAIAFDS